MTGLRDPQGQHITKEITTLQQGEYFTSCYERFNLIHFYLSQHELQISGKWKFKRGYQNKNEQREGTCGTYFFNLQSVLYRSNREMF